MKKKLIIFFVVVLAAFLFTACGEAVIITTPGGSYEFVEARLEETYNGVTAESGRTFLLIYIEGKSADMDDMSGSFFSNEKSSVSVEYGGENAPCQAIGYAALNEANPPDILATLVFDVPAATSETCVLSGDSIDAVTLKVKK